MPSIQVEQLTLRISVISLLMTALPINTHFFGCVVVQSWASDNFLASRQRWRDHVIELYWNAETIPKKLISRCLNGVATTNKNILHQQFWGLKSWWLCRGNVVACPALLLYLNSCYLGCKCWPARSVWGQSDPPADSLWTAPLLWNIYSYKQPMSLYDMHRRKI